MAASVDTVSRSYRVPSLSRTYRAHRVAFRSYGPLPARSSSNLAFYGNARSNAVFPFIYFRNRHCPQAGSFITDANEPLVAVEGDTISLHFTCKDMEGNVLNSTRDEDEPLTFEIGAGDIMRNQLFQGFDEAVRGLGVGDTTTLEAQGGDWKKELLFKVPVGHPEVERLQGRYKSQGGLKENMVVELVNGGLAVVVKMDEVEVTLDANNMMAGKTLMFELEVIGIERGT